MFGGLTKAQQNFQELVKCAIMSDAAFKNFSNEIADQCANAEIPV